MEIRGRGRGRGNNSSITSRLSGYNDHATFSNNNNNNNNNNNDQNYGNSQGNQRGRGRGGNRGRGQRGGGRGGNAGGYNNYGDANMAASSGGGGNVEVIVSNHPPGTDHQLLELSVTQLGSAPAPTPAHLNQPNKQQSSYSSLDNIQRFLQQRWNAEQKFLNLDKMGLDPLYKRVMHASTNDVRPAMFKLASETLGDIVTVSLSSNRLRSTQPISALAEYLPNVQNLSLQDNNISTYNDLEPLVGKFNNLHELLLNDNPIKTRDIERNGNDVQYRSEVTRRFPTLRMLDGAPVAQAIQFDIQAADLEATEQQARLPASVKEGFFDQDSSRMAANDFLGSFFPTFDGNRAALYDLYDENAMFSVSVNAGLPKHRQKPGGPFVNSGAPTDWRDISRNLTKVKSLKRRLDCLYYGSAAIIQLLTTMPPTVHDLTRADNFVTDAWQMNGFSGYPAVLFIKVHGEFRDGVAGNSTKYSFDRVFIVGPATPGSRAQAAGWNYVILSDQWHIREYSTNHAFQPEPDVPLPAFGQPAQAHPFPQAQTFAPPPAPQTFGSAQQQAPPLQIPQPQQSFASPHHFNSTIAPQPQHTFPQQSFTPPSVQSTPPPAPPPTPQVVAPTPPPSERPPGLSDQQHGNVLMLKQQTGLNYSFALQCLADNDWSMTNALESFERLKNINAIPPEAYGS
ncbi:hypothetical protein K450DRAFT_226374 [Umbelopsis ramanniana AG]|uniref:NTF2-like protein n=1 Tax=Umbelopsis ramanniana AG TaxID=1314678 RepID=A0AAD5EG05_UMBRA|nr:uncharacterized protein K450DRAFT_226374 [Umbelopsis ramanniana AG]KAI8582672.1 hypothetical protein K450DRAFT_226374 [Umbelopsis ramanniana AG]